ncbi:MAG: T9SS type A sorting domain-containing protein [Flavobacteriales bacterium]|nr:T9SS type A sorting domain-containing protein [Flavobacteriales bacterium]
MRNFITLCTMLAAHGLSAQVTLNYWMQAPTGTTVSIHLLTDMGSAVVPSDGINQIWDLSSVTLADLGDMTIQVAAGTPYAANYPNANWAYVQDLTGIGMEYIYFNINTTVLELVADDVPGGPNPYTDPKHILEFPLQYGNSFSDTYTDNDGTFTVTWTYAGHGTAITPLGTFANVVKMVSDEGDMVLWNTDPLYTLVVADGTSTVVFGPGTNGVNERKAPSLALAPNPCTDHLLIPGVEAADAWSVLDVRGRALRSGQGVFGNLQLDVRELTPGSYVVQLLGPNGRRTGRFIKE